MKTVLFVGAGRHQHRAILRAKELGLRVAAIDRNPDAPGFANADATEVVDFADVGAAVEIARGLGPDGVLTIASDRAVPVVAAVAEALGSRASARRRRGSRRTRWPCVRRSEMPASATSLCGGAHARRRADGRARSRPAGGAQARGLGRPAGPLGRPLGRRAPARLEDALAESQAGEAIVERFLDGVEVNCLAVARGGDVTVLTLSDRRRPDGEGFGVCLAHVFPTTIDGAAAAEAERVAAASVRALGLVDSVAYPQLLVSPDGVRLVEIAARVPAGLMDEVSRIGIGVDLVEVALRQALGEPVPDELLRPSDRRSLAIRFLTAEPGPLPVGVVRSVEPGSTGSLPSPGVSVPTRTSSRERRSGHRPGRRPPRLRDRSRRLGQGRARAGGRRRGAGARGGRLR